MPSVKISALPTSSILTDADRLLMVDFASSQTQQAPFSQVKSFLDNHLQGTTLTFPQVTASILNVSSFLTASVATISSLVLTKQNLDLNSITASYINTTRFSSPTIISPSMVVGTFYATSSFVSYLSSSYITSSVVTTNILTGNYSKINNYIDIAEVASVDTPQNGFGRLYCVDGRPFFKNDSGINFDLASGAVGDEVFGTGLANKIAIWQNVNNVTYDTNLEFSNLILFSPQMSLSSLTSSVITSSFTTSRFLTASSGFKVTSGDSYLQNTYVSGNLTISGALATQSPTLTITGNFVLSNVYQGYTILCNIPSGSVASISIPDALSQGYSNTFVQLNTGSITLVKTGGGSVVNRYGFATSNGVYSIQTVYHIGSNTHLLSGDLKTTETPK